MITAALVFAALAALLHVYIFTMESLTWTSKRTRAAFGTTAEEAETTKLLAFNQGFYNLFLAIVTGVGIAAVALGHNGVGVSADFRRRGIHGRRGGRAAGVVTGQGPGRADPGSLPGDRRRPSGDRPRHPLIRAGQPPADAHQSGRC